MDIYESIKMDSKGKVTKFVHNLISTIIQEIEQKWEILIKYNLLSLHEWRVQLSNHDERSNENWPIAASLISANTMDSTETWSD